MNKIILILIIFSFVFNEVYAQKETLKAYYNKTFLKEMKVYKADSAKIYKQFNISALHNASNTSRKLFFSQTSFDIYKNNKLSEKNSFYVTIFTFSELKKIIPNYKNLKDSIFSDSTTMFLKQITEKYKMQKQKFEQNLLLEKEQEMQKQIDKLENENKDIEKDDVIKEKDIIATDSIATRQNDTEKPDKNSKEELEKKLHKEEQKLKEEEQKMLKEKKRLEIEMKEMEKKENEGN